MTGRHQSAQYARYASSNQPYSNIAGNNNNLNIPFPSQNSSTPYSSQQYQYGNSPSMPSPYSSSSSPGYHSPNVQRNAQSIPLKKYTLQPPPRKLPLSKTMPSLGYPDIFPQRPGQEEDILTESNIRQGFIDKPIVSSENSSAHDIICGRLQEDQRALSDLSDFIVDVLHRQHRASYITGSSSFKPPMRTTLIDAKREQWMHELASGVIPLRKLARNVPHGFKGEKLLETLAIKQVPFLRATWYIKIVGLSEMSQRNASNAAASMGPQTIQWTMTVTSYLKKQLSELMPSHNGNANSAASPHATGGASNRGYKNYSHHDNPSKPWLSAESRSKFEQKWTYSVKLTHWQYYEGLLDQRTFLKWSLDTLAASSSFEIMWVILTGLVQDYVNEYKRNRTLTKLLIETLIKYYNALIQCINQGSLDEAEQRVHCGLQRDIETLLQSLFLSAPDMFVIPKLYHQYHHLLNMIIGEDSNTGVMKSSPDVRRMMNEYWTMVKARNEVFCGNMENSEMKVDKNIKSQSQSSPVHIHDDGNEERIVHILDSIGKNVDSITGLQIKGDIWVDARGRSAKWAAKAIFRSSSPSEPESIIKIVHSMCRWAINEARYGDWKAYLIASILLSWKEDNNTTEVKTLLQETLMRFLDGETYSENMSEDNEEVAMEYTNEDTNTTNQHIIYLFDVLIRLNLFSYQKYLLRLIARGDLEPKRRHEYHIQRRLHYLASFPLIIPTPAYLKNQRRVALYGSRQDSDKGIENESLNNLKHLARLAVMGFDHHDTDCLFGADAQDMTQPLSTDTFDSYNLAFSQELRQKFVDVMESTTRFIVLEFTSNWLLNEVKRFVVKSIQIGEDNWRVMTTPGSSLLNSRQLVTIIYIMECAKDYLSIIETAIWVLQKTNDHSLHPYIINTFRKYSCYWKLTNNSNRVINAIWTKHASLSSKGEKDKNIMMYMVQLVQEGYQMDDITRTQLQQDLQIKSKMRSHYMNNISVRNELLQLAKDPNISSVQLLAESLSLPSQNATGWIGLIFENVGEVLQIVSKEKRIYEEIKSYRHGRFLSQALFEFHRLLRAFAYVIKQVANATILTGQADTAVTYWLWNNGIVQEDMHKENSWVPLFAIMLVTNNIVTLDVLIKDFAVPWFERIGQEGHQQFCADDAKVNTFCQNLIILIRLLVIQNDNEPKSEEESATLSWQLRIEEFFLLEVQRQSHLACSLDRIEPLFSLMEQIIMIATNLPLSSSLLQDLVMLRADLLHIPWFRQACLRDLNGVYQRFASREAEAVTEKRLKKKMLNIVEELIGGDLLATQTMMQDTAPNFVDKLQRVFLNVSQWNEAQCRVQMNLLLDNISLYDASNQNPNNPHILSDDLSVNITQHTPASPPNKDLHTFVCFFYDAVLSDGKDDGEKATTLRRFQFFKNLIHELREPVLSELLTHGIRLLEGDASLSFPENMLLIQAAGQGSQFDADKFAYRSQAFLNIIQHMLAENIWPNEKKIELVKTIYRQIVRFRNSIPVYKVMQGANVCFSEAAAAIQIAKNDTDMAIIMLLTEGLPENVQIDNEIKLTLQELRTSLLLRLQLIVPYMSLIWEHPKEDECDILDWIRTLVPLLGSPLIHGNGSQEQFFEFMLDFMSLLIDEVPKDLKKASLQLLNSMHNELSSVPGMFQTRVKRIMPFLTHNIYLNSTRFASSILGLQPSADPQQQQQHLEACLEQSKPWEWLEDYANETSHDNDAPISLTLFNALKPKSVDNTYIKWFKFGFNAEIPNQNFTEERTSK